MIAAPPPEDLSAVATVLDGLTNDGSDGAARPVAEWLRAQAAYAIDGADRYVVFLPRNIDGEAAAIAIVVDVLATVLPDPKARARVTSYLADRAADETIAPAVEGEPL